MHIRTGPPECQNNSFLSFAEWFLVDLLNAIKHHEIQTKMHIQGRRTVKKIWWEQLDEVGNPPF